MRKLVAAINMTVDGFCDHTAVSADAAIHQHYTELINNAGALLYGRITYQLMENYWPLLVERPSGVQSEDAFAVAIDRVQKIVFSHTLESVNWKTARLAKKDIKDEVAELKQQPGKDIVAGSPSLIVALTNLNLIDELQLCVHPVLVGNGLPLFKNIRDKTHLALFNTKSFGSGAIVLYYKPAKK